MNGTVLALALISGGIAHAELKFSQTGYLRIGVGESNGGDFVGMQLNGAFSKYRLGNEPDFYGEFGFNASGDLSNGSELVGGIRYHIAGDSNDLRFSGSFDADVAPRELWPGTKGLARAPSLRPRFGPGVAITNVKTSTSTTSTTKIIRTLMAMASSDWNREIVYFVIPDRFADGRANQHEVDISEPGYFHGGDWKGLANQLPYLDDLGITAIWIAPIVDNIEGFVDEVGFPDWGYHGYWADDFTKLDARLGSQADLKSFVDRAHARDMKFLVDVVFNHVGHGSEFLEKHPDWVGQGAQCGNTNETLCLFGLPDLRTERQDVTEHVPNAHAAWVEAIGFDGYRIYTAKHVAPNVLAQNQKLVEARFGANFLTLGEVWGADKKALSNNYFEPGLLNGGIDFSFHGATEAWISARGRTFAYAKGYLAKRHAHTQGAVLAHYLSSHDETGLLHRLKGDKDAFKLAAGLQITSIGMPIIFYGEEVARNTEEWPDNRTDMHCGASSIKPGAGIPQGADMLQFYRQLITVRRATPALAMGDYTHLSFEDDLLVFSRSWDGGNGDHCRQPWV